MQTVLIIGCNGQIGSYYAEFLLNRGFEVIGTVRKNSNLDNIKCIKNPYFILKFLDLKEIDGIIDLIEKYKPDYLINCAASTSVFNSFNKIEDNFQFNVLSIITQLEGIVNCSPDTKYLNFGSVEELYQEDKKSPYANSKIIARDIIKFYKDSYNIFAIQPYCFNIESPRRSKDFLSRKITSGIARIINSIKNKETFEPIKVGNIYSYIDYTHVLDLVEGTWLSLNQNEPRDYIFGTGRIKIVKDFIDECLKQVNIEGEWIGNDYDKKFVISNYLNDVSGLKSDVIIKINKDFYRQTRPLIKYINLASENLKWTPKISFESLVREMLIYDLNEYGIDII